MSKVTGEIVKRTVASKLRQHQRDPAGAGVRVAEVPAELRDVPCLADAEILALADLGRRVSEHYGAPQDIEWAITSRGTATVAGADAAPYRPAPEPPGDRVVAPAGHARRSA